MNAPFGHTDQLVLEGEDIGRPDLWDHPKGSLELGIDLRDLDVGCAGLGLGSALADTEIHPTVRENVEHRDPLGDFDRMVHPKRKTDHAMTNPDAQSLAGAVGKKGLGRAHMRILAEAMMLDGPYAIEAEFVPRDDLFHTIMKDLLLVGR